MSRAFNQLVVPAGVPLHFSLTSASVMNVFFVPQLGSMIYTMNGMRTQLNLQADAPGTFRGLSAHFSGDGFPDMHFDVLALPAERFAAWIEATRNTGPTPEFRKLCRPRDAEHQYLSVHLPRCRSRAVPADRHTETAAWTWPADRAASSERIPADGGLNLWGKLSWAAIQFDQPIPMIASGVVSLVIIGVLAWVTLKGWFPYLWREWITSVDHKHIGIMYILLAMVMLLRGFSDAIMMRSQQALAFQSPGYLPPEHYNRIFTAHGTLMIFFVAMPFVIGLMNFVVPLQLGVRDVAFPTLNSVGFWLTATGALLVNISLVVGEFARTGWLPYPPLSELIYSPGVGVDYYLWSIEISGVGTLLAAINLVTTVLKLHAPGMTYMRMPMFCWTTLATSVLIVAAFPILTATLAMLVLDFLGFHFFTNNGGGNQMMFVNPVKAFWTSGGLHPRSARLRRILGSGLDVLRQATVRLPLDGRRDNGHLYTFLHGLAAPLLHDGRRRRRQRDLRHRFDDHRGAHGRK